MPLDDQGIEIVDYIKEHLPEWLDEYKASHSLDISLQERMIRIEEELKHQRELMMQGFEMTNKRFEEISILSHEAPSCNSLIKQRFFY